MRLGVSQSKTQESGNQYFKQIYISSVVLLFILISMQNCHTLTRKNVHKNNQN